MRTHSKTKHIAAAVIFFLLFSFSMRVCAASLMDITVGEAPEYEVRYTTDTTTYVEALIDDQWVGRCWSANGRVDELSSWFTDPAFEIRIQDEPCPLTTLGIPPNSGWEWACECCCAQHHTPRRTAPHGTAVSTGWKWVRASEAPRTDRGGRHVIVELSNVSFPIDVNVHTLLDGTPVLARWLEITNRTAKPIALTELFPWAGTLWTEEASFTLGGSPSRNPPCPEGFFAWKKLPKGVHVEENFVGLVWDDPYFVLRNETNGEYFFGQLGWPVNYVMEFNQENGLSFRMGPSTVNALRVLDPGETVRSPTVHLGHVVRDFDATVQAMHDHIRRSVLPKRDPEKAFLVQYLIPEDQPMTVYHGEEFNEENLKKCIDVAEAAGVELFLLDGPKWAEGYGDWVAKKKNFPCGLQPLVRRAHEKGLLFGVYAELEGGRGDWSQSKAFREHPEWFVQRHRHWPDRNFINMANPAAASYVESELRRIIEDNRLDLYRHDINGTYGGQGSETLRHGFVENDYWRHYEAFYSMSERIHKDYPELILQMASGGGTRLEMATLSHWQEHFTSDRTSMPHMQQMTAGLSVYLPLEILVHPHGMAPSNELPDVDTQLRGLYGLGYTPVIFNSMLPKSLEEFPNEKRERFQRYAKLYKSFIRPLLPTSKLYHHAPINADSALETRNWFEGVKRGDWLVLEFMTPDQGKGWATFICVSNDESDEYHFKAKGLDMQRKYRVTFDTTGETRTFEGDMLMTDGLVIRRSEKNRSELLLFEEL